MLDGWRKADPPTKKKLPVDVDVPNLLMKLGLRDAETELVRAVGCLTLVAIYFLLRSAKYTHYIGREDPAAKQTQQFRVKDISFFATDPATGRLRQISPHARDVEILAVEVVTLRLENQKNGWKNMCVHQERNGNEFAYPVVALALRVIEIRRHMSCRDTPLSAYWQDGERRDVTDNDVCKALKAVAELLKYPDLQSIDINQVDTHSLRRGGANALHAAGFSDRQIVKMERWKSKTFIEYIHKELGHFSSGMPRAMARSLKYVNVTGDRWVDVTDAVAVSDGESDTE